MTVALVEFQDRFDDPTKASGSAVNLGVRNGAIYLSRSPIPGGRGGRPRKRA